MLTAWNSQYLQELYDEFGGHWVIEACRDAASLNKKNLKYINAILNGWKANGFRVDTRKKTPQRQNAPASPARPPAEEW